MDGWMDVLEPCIATLFDLTTLVMTLKMLNKMQSAKEQEGHVAVFQIGI